MDAFDEKSASFLANKRQLTDFLTSDADGVYQRRVAKLLANEETRLIINVDDLRKHDPQLARNVLTTPMLYLAPFQSALREYVLSQVGEGGDGGVDAPLKRRTEYTIGLDGNFGELKVSPRQLQAQHLGKLVCVEGIATRCSIVRPKVQRTVHYCEKTGVESSMSYHDSTSLSGFPTSSVYPTKDAAGNPLTTEFGLSSYTDHQTLVIQEMPERAPAGLLPSSVDVVLDDDLVDACKPGDRVAIVGVYRALPNKSQGATSGLFRSVLIANHVRHLGKSIGANAPITPGDTKNIREVSKRADVFELLGRSVAPSIYGHEFIKKALVLLLLGGVEKNLDNGTHIRGDINMLFVGDPSTAKSQLLRFILHIAPLALNTTGRGSSGVGLTAAVTQDKETGERRLEAGAMVLADRGVVCIDEFDKMSDADRVAIHEVMEQQTVTISKAGIHMSLNARCSVVAAANPRYSHYDSSKPTTWNVNLPDSLLSRFDFLFIILDTPDAEHDRHVADKVLSNHRYQRRADADDDELMDYNAARSEQAGGGAGAEAKDTDPYQKFDRLLHSGLLKAGSGRRGASSGVTGGRKLDILSIPFMKKYIQYARAQSEPVLTNEAAEFIGHKYAELRQAAAEGDRKENSFPITARSLETLIRLSSAHAKARLDDQVTVDDVEQVLAILRFAMDHDSGRQGQDEADMDDDDEDEDGGEGGDSGDEGRDRAPRSPQASPARPSRAPRTPGRSASKRKAAGTPSATPQSAKRGRAATGRQQREADAEAEAEQSEQASAEPATAAASSAEESAPEADASMQDAAPAAATAAAAAPAEPVAESAPIPSLSRPRASIIPTSARQRDLQTHLVHELKAKGAEFVSYKALLASLNARADKAPYEADEVDAILKLMERENKIMWRSGNVYKV